MTRRYVPVRSAGYSFKENVPCVLPPFGHSRPMAVYERSEARRLRRVSTSTQVPSLRYSSAICSPNSKSAPLSLYMLQSSCVWSGCICQVTPLTGTADAYSLGAVRNDRVQTKSPTIKTVHAATVTIDTVRRNINTSFSFEIRAFCLNPSFIATNNRLHVLDFATLQMMQLPYQKPPSQMVYDLRCDKSKARVKLA